MLVIPFLGWVVITLTNAAVYKCPDWIRRDKLLQSAVFGYVCYYTNHEPQTWQGATKVCSGNGGQLAKVTTAEVNQFFNSLGWTYMWIGARKYNGEWFWSDGDPVRYTDWSGTSADELMSWFSKTELCVYYLTWEWESTGRWRKWNCERRYSFICQNNAEPNDTKSSESTNAILPSTTMATVHSDMASEPVRKTRQASLTKINNNPRYIQESPTWETTENHLVQCVRNSVATRHQCVVFNYESSTGKCRTFNSTKALGQMTSTPSDWQVWLLEWY